MVRTPRTINYAEALQLLPTSVAKAFIHDKLHVADFDHKFASDKLNVLGEILMSWQDKIPFQTVTQMALPPKERKAPTMTENVQSIMTLQGGRCWTHNAVMHALLTSLGFDAIQLVGSVFAPGSENHALVLIRGLAGEHSQHVVDVGFGAYHPTPVSLDFKEKSETVYGVNKPYRYVKYDDYFVLCHRLRGDEKLPESTVIRDGWAQMCYFSQELEERSYAQLQRSIGDLVYTNMDMPFNKDVYCVQCTNGCTVVLRNLKLVVEQSPGGDIVKTNLQSDEDVLEAFAKHFPALPTSDVVKALKNRISDATDVSRRNRNDGA